ALACELMTCCLDLLRAAAHQALGATQVRVHIDIEQLDKELMQIRMDEARLREESLGRGLVVGLSVRGEVRRMTDAPPIAMAAARMHSEALEIQEQLHLRLGQLHAQALVAMDVRCAVIDR